MKTLATITGEKGEQIALVFEPESNMLCQQEGEAAIERTGPIFRNEEEAAQYILDSWGRGWDLTWVKDA